MTKHYLDIPKKFWLEWLNSDESKRTKMLKKTLLVRELSEYMSIKFKDAKLNKNFTSDYAARIVNDYFQDLETVLKQKNDKTHS